MAPRLTPGATLDAGTAETLQQLAANAARGWALGRQLDSALRGGDTATGGRAAALLAALVRARGGLLPGSWRSWIPSRSS